jgi:hypothetical protein
LPLGFSRLGVGLPVDRGNSMIVMAFVNETVTRAITIMEKETSGAGTAGLGRAAGFL